MKLSRHMRMSLDAMPDEGEMRAFYATQFDPLVKRGLMTYEMRDVQITIRAPVGRLTALGRSVKHQNTDD